MGVARSGSSVSVLGLLEMIVAAVLSVLVLAVVVVVVVGMTAPVNPQVLVVVFAVLLNPLVVSVAGSTSLQCVDGVVL